MVRHTLHPETILQIEDAKMTENSKNSFLKVTKYFFYFITIFGFRTFAIPGECCRIASFSPIGVVFSLPGFAIAGYYIYYMYNQCVYISNLMGFFSGQPAVLFQMLLCYILLFGYLFVSLICTRKLCLLVQTLDSIKITAKSRKQFSIFVIVIFMVAVILHIILTYIMIDAYYQVLKMTQSSAFQFFDYLSYFSFVYAIACGLYPLTFLAFLVSFLDRAFSEHTASMKNFPKNKIEDQLPVFYIHYLKLANILEEVDSIFNFVILQTNCVSLINLSTFILDQIIKNFGFFPTNMVYSMVFIMVLNFLGFSFLCIRMNEKSRALRQYLHEILPHNTNTFRWVDTFHQKIKDDRWGLTVGKFFLFERTTFIGLLSAMVTFLALYGQFAQSASPIANATSLDAQSYFVKVHNNFHLTNENPFEEKYDVGT